jgi:hypothetical protein
MLSAPQIYKALHPKTEISSIVEAIVSLGFIALSFIVVVVPKGQVNLSFSLLVTIVNSDFSFRRNDGWKAVAESPPLKGARGMTNSNYRTEIG